VTDQRYLELQIERSRRRLRELTAPRPGGARGVPGGSWVVDHPGLALVAFFAAAFVLGRVVLPRLRGRLLGRALRWAMGWVGGALDRAVSEVFREQRTPAEAPPRR
jgi:hypothetical protein